MGSHFDKWMRIAVMATMFCVAGLVMTGEAQADRFVNNGNGTVTDTQTGLMWANRDNGSDINWYNAKSYCAGYSGGGKSGWRMPTIDELHQLYNSGAYGSVINKTGDFVWASETRGSEAAFFNFSSGNRHWSLKLSESSADRALPVRSS